MKIEIVNCETSKEKKENDELERMVEKSVLKYSKEKNLEKGDYINIEENHTIIYEGKRKKYPFYIYKLVGACRVKK